MNRTAVWSLLFCLFATPVLAQECSVEDQASLDLCTIDAIATCRAAYSEACERHEATLAGALSRFEEQCCERRSEAPRNRAGYDLCKRTFLRLTRPTQKLFGSEFAAAVRDNIRAHSYTDCAE